MSREKRAFCCLVRDGEELTAVIERLNPAARAFVCYSHAGQHSACSLDWIKAQTDEVPADETQKLLAELRDIGSNNLVIVPRSEFLALHAQPVPRSRGYRVIVHIRAMDEMEATEAVARAMMGREHSWKCSASETTREE